MAVNSGPRSSPPPADSLAVRPPGDEVDLVPLGDARLKAQPIHDTLWASGCAGSGEDQDATAGLGAHVPVGVAAAPAP